MHRCEVKMRDDLDTPDDELIACGTESNKKMGTIWVCDPHYNMFRGAIDRGVTDGCRMAVDSTEAEDAENEDTFFVTPGDPESI
jgi:hypothetical protein